MPAVRPVHGYRFFFFSMEGREPPHIHVAHAGRNAKFWLEPVAVADVRGFRSHELTKIRQIMVEEQQLVLGSRHEYFSGKS